MCAPYNMTVCKQYLSNQRVFFNLTYPYGAQHNENAVLGAVGGDDYVTRDVMPGARREAAVSLRVPRL